MCKLRESQQDLYKCHIQEMSPNKGSCLVFVEELAEKHSVPYSYLKPLPQYRCFYNRCSYQPLEVYKTKKSYDKRGKNDGLEWNKYSKRGNNNYKCIEDTVDLNPYTDLSNFQPYSYEIVAMPMTTIARSDRNGNRSNNRSNSNNQTSGEKPLRQPTPLSTDDVNDFNRNNNVNNPDGQTQIQPNEVSGQIVPNAYAGNAQGMVQYYLSPIPQTEYSDQLAYAMSNTEMIAHQNMYPMQPGLSYGNTVPNNTVYISMPVGPWPNYSPHVNSPG